MLQALRVQAPVMPRSHEHVLQPSNQERHVSGHWPLGLRLQPTAPAQLASHWFEYVKPSPHFTGSKFFGHVQGDSVVVQYGGSVVVVVGSWQLVAFAQLATHGFAYVRPFEHTTGLYSREHWHVDCLPMSTSCAYTASLMGGAAVCPKSVLVR